MKKLFLLLFISCAFLASPLHSTAEVAVLKSDTPPVKTYYLGYFEWSGDMHLPASTYQVLADPSDTTKILYLYDAYNDISYECLYSTYDAVNKIANITLNSPTHGMVYWGSVGVVEE